MLVVCWSFSAFTFDRESYAIVVDVFSDGYFERNARLNADPAQIDRIDQSLRSLRILSPLDFFTRVGTNLMLCFRLRRIIAMAREAGEQRHALVYPVQRSLVGLFFVIPVLTFVFVSQSAASSARACAAHPECAVHALRWTSVREGDLAQCRA